MKVVVKLFASLRTNREKEILMDLKEDSTPKTIMEQIYIPEDDVAIIMINGRRKEIDTVIQENDTISFFPPVGGG